MVRMSGKLKKSTLTMFSCLNAFLISYEILFIFYQEKETANPDVFVLLTNNKCQIPAVIRGLVRAVYQSPAI